MPGKPQNSEPTSLLGQMSKEHALRTAAWVAEFLSVSRDWVDEATASGALPSIRVGDVVRFNPERIKEWARGAPPAPSVPVQQDQSILADLRAQLKALQATRPMQPGAAAVTVEQAAALLGCAKTRIFELLKSGEVKRGKRVGRRTMVRTSSITTFTEVAPKPRPDRIEKTKGGQRETRAEILRKLKQRG